MHQMLNVFRKISFSSPTQIFLRTPTWGVYSLQFTLSSTAKVPLVTKEKTTHSVRLEISRVLILELRQKSTLLIPENNIRFPHSRLSKVLLLSIPLTSSCKILELRWTILARRVLDLRSKRQSKTWPTRVALTLLPHMQAAAISVWRWATVPPKLD